MKKILAYIFSGALLSFALVSCNLNSMPEFDDADSFAAFTKVSYQFNENAGSISIPVTVASVEPKNTIVTYEVVDGTAKLGDDYTLADESAVLTFDGKIRTANIVINISDKYVGQYTGSKTFTIKLVSGGSVNLGAEDSCTITIADLDHPLNDILGSYTASATDYWSGNTSWDLELVADPDGNTAMVWIYGISASFPGETYKMYGNVSGEIGERQISVPLGQSFKYSSYELSLWDFDGQYLNNTGNLEFTAAAGGFATASGYGIGYEAEENSVSLFDLYLPGVTWTKK